MLYPEGANHGPIPFGASSRVSLTGIHRWPCHNPAPLTWVEPDQLCVCAYIDGRWRFNKELGLKGHGVGPDLIKNVGPPIAKARSLGSSMRRSSSIQVKPLMV